VQVTSCITPGTTTPFSIQSKSEIVKSLLLLVTVAVGDGLVHSIQNSSDSTLIKIRNPPLRKNVRQLSQFVGYQEQ